MKRCLPRTRKQGQDLEWEECDDGGKIYILRLNVSRYFENLGLASQLKGCPNDSQEMGGETCSFKILAVPDWPSV